MDDYSELKTACEYAAQDTIKFADESEEMRALQQFHEEVDPETILALIAENKALKGSHDWLVEDLIKELVDNAQSFQENACEEGEDPFVVVLLAAASRIRRQEGNIDKLKAENEQLAKTADCWDRLNIQNKALSDSFRAERDQLMAENERLKTLRSTTERDLAQELEVWRHGPSCWNCGDTGDVHDMVGEWRGQCDCNAAKLIEVASERDQLKADNEALRKDAERYRWLRIADWWRSPMCVIRNPKDQARLGSDCPSSDRLDAAIDAAMGKGEQS